MCCSAGAAEVSVSSSVTAPVSLQVAALHAPSPDTLKARSQKISKKRTKVKKERVPAAAAVTMKRNISRATVTQRSTEGSHVEVVIMDGGLNLRSPEDLQMIGSSGAPVSNNSHIGFDNVVLPFSGSIRFKSPNKMKTVIYDREVNFKINEPGRWVLRIDI